MRDGLLERFVCDRAGFTDADYDALLELLERDPDAVVQVKELLILEEWLSRDMSLDRQDMNAQVAQRIRDENAGSAIARAVIESRNRARKKPRSRKPASSGGWFISGAALLAAGILLFAVFGLKHDVEVLEVLAAKDANGLLTGTRVAQGVTIQTGANGAVDLRIIRDGTLLSLSANTQFNVSKAPNHFDLATGSLKATVARQDPNLPLIVSTPQAEARVVGTRLKLNVEEGASLLEVEEGKVQFNRNDGASVQVAAGQFALATPKGALEVKSVLPLAEIATAPRTPQRILRVGPGMEYANLNGLPELKAGDTIEIQPNSATVIRRFTAEGTADMPITLRGVGAARPVFDAGGVEVSGIGETPRALLQIEGGHYVIENLEIRNAHNGHNGAGLRLMSSKGTVIRDCRITGCDSGIMSDGESSVTIERCEIDHNGSTSPGLSHNCYLAGKECIVRDNYIHDAISGVNFKSNCAWNEISGNYIADSADGELHFAGEDRFQTVFILLSGNVITSKADRGQASNTSRFIEFGSESITSLKYALVAVNNTLAAGNSAIHFLQCSGGRRCVLDAKLYNNIFYGSPAVLGAFNGDVAGEANWLPTDAIIPAGLSKIFHSVQPGFASPQTGDFRLRPDSVCAGTGVSSAEYVDSSGKRRSGIPMTELLAPGKPAPRRPAAPNLGAMAIAEDAK